MINRYEVLSTEQVVAVLFRELEEVRSVVQIPATTLRVLLNHFKWDKGCSWVKFSPFEVFNGD